MGYTKSEDTPEAMSKRKRVGLRVKLLLEERGWSQARLAKLAHMPQSRISDILGGSVNLTINSIVALEKALGASIIDIANPNATE